MGQAVPAVAWQLLVWHVWCGLLVKVYRNADRRLRREIAAAGRALKQRQQQPRNQQHDQRKSPQASGAAHRRTRMHGGSIIAVTVEEAARYDSHGVPELSLSDAGGYRRQPKRILSHFGPQLRLGEPRVGYSGEQRLPG